MERSRVFICYRHDDSAGHAIALHDRLRTPFDTFRDVDGIAPGSNFVQAVHDALTTTSVVLVLIGRQWLTELERRQREQPDDEDYVRREVQLALQVDDIRTVPVLLSGTAMPRRSQLPDDIKDLAIRDAVALRDDRWADDVSDLIAELRQFVPPRRRPRNVHVARGLAGVAALMPSMGKSFGTRAVLAGGAALLFIAGLWFGPRLDFAPLTVLTTPPRSGVPSATKEGDGVVATIPTPSSSPSPVVAASPGAPPAASPAAAVSPVPTTAQVAFTDGAGLFLRASPAMGATRIQPPLMEGVTLRLLGDRRVIDGETWYFCEQPEVRIQGWAPVRYLRLGSPGPSPSPSAR